MLSTSVVVQMSLASKVVPRLGVEELDQFGWRLLMIEIGVEICVLKSQAVIHMYDIQLESQSLWTFF